MLHRLFRMQSGATVSSLTGKKEPPPWHWGFPGGSVVKEPTCQCRRLGFDFLVRTSPWRRKWWPTPGFLPGKSHRNGALPAAVYRVTGSQTQLSTNWACTHPDSTGSFSWKGKYNRIQQGTRTCTISVMWVKLQLVLPLLLMMILHLYNPHLLSLLQPLSLLARSHDVSPCIPAVVLYYCTFQGTVL